MATYPTVIKKWNGTEWEEAYPKTIHTQIVASGDPSSSTFLRGDGVWATAGNTVKLTVTTASATVAKTTTEAVTFAENVPYLVLFTLGNSASGPTLNGINIRLSTSNATTTTFSLGANTLVPMYYNATTNVMQITGSYRTGDETEDYNLRWENSVTAGAQITQYKLIMEGIDGRFYPLTIENTTAATKTVSTQQFRLNGIILHYQSTTTQAENATFSNVWVSEYSSGTIHYTFNQSSGFVAYRSVYLKGTINSNGHFVLDNTTLTSWLTQTLPTTDDGFVYVYLGITNNTTTAFRLEVTHPIYEFKDGKLRQYTPTHTHDDRYYTESEADTRFVNTTGDTMTGTLVIGQIDAGNPGATADNLRVSGYGILGNRGSMYVTNQSTSGDIQFGIGGVHAAATKMKISSNGVVDIGGNTVWHAGNDGSGSGLDADLLDGNHASAFLLTSAVKEQLKFLYIYGKAQSAITKGQAVQFAGVQGDHILMKPAVPSEINANPDYFIGIAEATLATNDFGYILTQGELVNVNTSAYTAGNILWFASAGSTAGALTATEPTNSNARIQVASVNKVNATEGILFVRVNFVGTEIEDIVATGTPGATTFLRGDGSWNAVTATNVGLGNVDNTSDANKPVSTAQQTALNLKLNTSARGAANGVASLDANSKIPVAQLPNSVFDSLYIYGTAGAGTTNLRELGLAAVADASTVGRSAIGYYWVMTAGGTVQGTPGGQPTVTVGGLVAATAGVNPSEEGVSSALGVTLETGDWFILVNITGAGTVESPYGFTFATVNNTYELASTTIDGIVRLSNTTTISSATTGSQVITQGVLGGLIGTAANTIAAGNDARFTDARTPLSHTHGNITNAGAIGSTADLVAVTTTSGVLTTASRSGIDSRTAFPTTYANITGTVPTWNQSTTGNAATATTAQSVVQTVTGTTSAELVRGNMADNDQFRILVGGTASNAGFAEIATADDGTEPIHVRQYTGVFTTLVRTATLLDGSGNTSLPGSLTVGGNISLTGASSLSTSTGALTLSTAAGNGNIILSPNGTGVITSTARLGLGTTSPTSVIHVKNATPEIKLEAGSTTDSGTMRYNTTTKSIEFIFV